MRNIVCGQPHRFSDVIPRVLALIVCVVPVNIAFSADGDFDPSWSLDGLAFAGDPGTVNRGYGIALQCDGKVVAVGAINGQGWNSDAGVIRFNSDGSLDSSFASNGVFAISFGSIGDTALSVAVQPDGKIVVAGTDTTAGGDRFFVMRLTANGSLDSAFSGDGYHLFQVGGPSDAAAVALQDDGKIVVVGWSSTDTAMAIARLTTTGQLDTSFDGDGMVLIDFTLGYDDAWGVEIQDDGRILVVGTASIIGGSVVAVLRLLDNGSLDTSFGPGATGATAIDFGIYSEGRGIALQDDGKIVIVGETDHLTSVAVARLTDTGILDPSFGVDGMVTRDFGLGPDVGFDVGVQRDGGIVVSGYVSGSSFPVGAVMRFTPSGAVDTSFGNGGVSVVSLADETILAGMAMQPNDGKVVAAGYVDYGIDDSRVMVIRLVGDSALIFASDFECGDTSAWN